MKIKHGLKIVIASCIAGHHSDRYGDLHYVRG